MHNNHVLHLVRCVFLAHNLSHSHPSAMQKHIHTKIHHGQMRQIMKWRRWFVLLSLLLLYITVCGCGYGKIISTVRSKTISMVRLFKSYLLLSHHYDIVMSRGRRRTTISRRSWRVALLILGLRVTALLVVWGWLWLLIRH